jgi:hypothetical protein
MEITKEQFEGTAKNLEKIAQEPADSIEFFYNAFVFFGSKAATQRLQEAFVESDVAFAGYSKEFDQYWFKLETTPIVSTNPPGLIF